MYLLGCLRPQAAEDSADIGAPPSSNTVSCLASSANSPPPASPSPKSLLQIPAAAAVATALTRSFFDSKIKATAVLAILPGDGQLDTVLTLGGGIRPKVSLRPLYINSAAQEQLQLTGTANYLSLLRHLVSSCKVLSLAIEDAAWS